MGCSSGAEPSAGRWRWIPLVLTLCGIVGCNEFTEPLCEEADSVVDARLLGDWDLPPDERDGTEWTESVMTVQRVEGQTTLRFITSGLHRGQRQEERHVGRVVTIGDRSFLSVRSLDPEVKEPGFLLLQYRFVAPDEVHFYLLETKAVEAEIRAGRLPGQSRMVPPPALLALLGAKPREEFSVTATAAEIRAYLAQHPDICFDLKEPVITLKRRPREASPAGQEDKPIAVEVAKPVR